MNTFWRKTGLRRVDRELEEWKSEVKAKAKVIV